MADPTSELDAKTRLAETLWNDPETRPGMEALVAKKFPHAKGAMPAFVVREENARTTAELRKIIDDDKKERMAERATRDLETVRAQLMADPELHVRADEIEPIEKLMVEETIGSHKAAARLYRAQQQVAAPRSEYESSSMQIPGLRGAGGDEYKGLVEDPDAWARDRSHQILADFRNGRGNQWL